MPRQKNIVIFANIVDNRRNNFLFRKIGEKTYRFLRQEATERKVPIHYLFSSVLRRVYKEDIKKKYLSLSFVKDTLK